MCEYLRPVGSECEYGYKKNPSANNSAQIMMSVSKYHKHLLVRRLTLTVKTYDED